MAGSKLHLQVVDGHLRVVPKGYLTDLRVKRILGATQASLLVFPAGSANILNQTSEKRSLG